MAHSRLQADAESAPIDAAEPTESRSKWPSYSVLLSTYHGDNPDWLHAAIESMLVQSVKPAEFVLVKDGPLGNDLDKVISTFTSRHPDLFNVVSLPANVGLGLALKTGVERCSHELIARIDADDISHPERVERQLEMMARQPELHVVGSLVDEFIESPDIPISRVTLPEHHEGIAQFAKRRCPVRHPSLLFRKSAVARAGNYRHVLLAEDYDLVVRMLLSGSRFHNIPKVLHYVRVSADFYRRRGGISYVVKVFRFKNEFRRIGFLTITEFLATLLPHMFVALMPGRLREFVYRNVLRN